MSPQTTYIIYFWECHCINRSSCEISFKGINQTREDQKQDKNIRQSFISSYLVTSMLNISAVCENRWINNGYIASGKYRIIRAGGARNERGVGFILDQDMKKWFLGYYQLFARILTFKLKGKHFNITIIVYMHQ